MFPTKCPIMNTLPVNELGICIPARQVMRIQPAEALHEE